MQKIKVLHIIKSLGRGGAEMLLPETLKLHQQGTFEFHYIYFLPWKNQMVKEIQRAGGKVHCISASNNLKLLSKYNTVEKYCRDEKIDLIHCHLPWSGFLGRIVHKRTNIPVIYTEHNIQERYHFATKYLNKASFNAQTIALGVSQDVTRSINENIKPQIPVKTVLNGVNTSRFTKNIESRIRIRKKYNIPDSAVVIGNIAVFREQKNLTGWLKAFNLVSQKNSGVYGILVGAGPKENEIVQLIQELKLEKRVFLVGLQTDTVSYFSAMDVFMMSSLFEGLPIALLEAMSMECAVVSTKAGGVVEVVRDGKDGLLCEVDDWNSLGGLTLNVVEDPIKMQELQKAARKRVENSFSLTSMVKELENTYLDVHSGLTKK